jgi:predicted glycogen debranching enzyme
MERLDMTPEALSVTGGGSLDRLLEKEWLLTNRIGAYASSSVVGCNTRRYHGLLVASASPPVGRFLAVATVREQLVLDGEVIDLSTFEFDNVFSPKGFERFIEFRNDAAATFIFRVGSTEIIKEVALAEASNSVILRYTIHGSNAVLKLWPFVALRDFHHVRRVHEPHQMTFQQTETGAVVQDLKWPDHNVHFLTSDDATFEAKAQWWYRFRYRLDIARGQEGSEDLYTPGSFDYSLSDGQPCLLTACADHPEPTDFDALVARRRKRLTDLAGSVGPSADDTTRRLAVASDAFVVRRTFPGGQKPSASILAGFPWFADWGRDAFIALPGILICTKRYELAREVFQTFSSHLGEGMIPNRYDDYSTTAHYNSIDASLWFIIAAERYLAATGDDRFWRDTLMPVADAILTHYQNGTRFDIHADADGLLTGGSPQTQLTWMDAKLGDETVTPRHGKAVEINALWHSAHRIMAERCRGVDDARSEHYAGAAEIIAKAFSLAFWDASRQCLYDCVKGSDADESIRPNQIFAVSLPHSPLGAEQRADVVRTVTEHLLTPLGLRTLSPTDWRYRRRYGGSWESRDRAYHQGTVWPWLIGPFIEAYLKVEGDKRFAVERARQWLSAFDGHLREVGLGQVSEIADGDSPHMPRGCIAQAWSVGEVLRAKLLVDECALRAE